MRTSCEIVGKLKEEGRRIEGEETKHARDSSQRDLTRYGSLNAIAEAVGNKTRKKREQLARATKTARKSKRLNEETTRGGGGKSFCVCSPSKYTRSSPRQCSLSCTREKKREEESQ